MATPVRFDPFAELRAIQQRFLGDDFFTDSARAASLPTTDVYTEDDKRLVVEAHLPNFSDDDIEIQVDDGALVIRAQRKNTEPDDDRKYLVRESSSSFYRRIQLPERSDEAGITADFDKGVLKVTVPFQEIAAPKKIEINGGHSASTPAVEENKASQ
ncbi:Hsp20/alpha crystallin family protein [Corynebacterium pacaense]|uniref:Hsp20/alpha crystallin family protein n=1 Tax=Corynebacterium pacaense TaxID=1816684 RepID=UPI0009BACF95|nr:Hsp20/alpha crystallin family protein [Corynebacterium pacaense]